MTRLISRKPAEILPITYVLGYFRRPTDNLPITYRRPTDNPPHIYNYVIYIMGRRLRLTAHHWFGI